MERPGPPRHHLPPLPLYRRHLVSLLPREAARKRSQHMADPSQGPAPRTGIVLVGSGLQRFAEPLGFRRCPLCQRSGTHRLRLDVCSPHLLAHRLAQPRGNHRLPACRLLVVGAFRASSRRDGRRCLYGAGQHRRIHRPHLATRQNLLREHRPRRHPQHHPRYWHGPAGDVHGRVGEMGTRGAHPWKKGCMDDRGWHCAAGHRPALEPGFSHQQEALDQQLRLRRGRLFPVDVCAVLLSHRRAWLAPLDTVLHGHRPEQHHHLSGPEVHQLQLHG